MGIIILYYGKACHRCNPNIDLPPLSHPRVSPILWELPIICFSRLSMFDGFLSLHKFYLLHLHRIFGVPIASQVNMHVHVCTCGSRAQTQVHVDSIQFLPSFPPAPVAPETPRGQSKDQTIGPLLRSTLTGIGYSDFSRFRAARRGLRLDGGVVAHSMYLVKFVVSRRGFS